MSFITKRERVFNEYELFDLPARNEGKLKAYSSCTDARAWSHFCSDKTEHLVEIIKRNNDTCPAKYIPTNVIVDTLMVAKNAEIARLKRKIGEFEQMIEAYDLLELTCEQKCEIAHAHAAIKAANKELDELCLDLDLSGFTEGIDSEAFETGKSRGDEPAKYRTDEWLHEREQNTPKMIAKSNQIGDTSDSRDASTYVTDRRIEEMQDSIIGKDAKLNAMQNTIAVMENDVCEPYCIYAHIYTALEKIFAALCQNDKYKQYLNLLVAGKDTRYIDTKGKILFKLKVLEKFSLALIAPCSQQITSQDCTCYRAELVSRVETTYALTSAEMKIPSLDNKRAQLVADIMENDEMKEILSKESGSIKNDTLLDEDFHVDNYTIEEENLKRLKNLQINYDDLMTCYEALKHEKSCLQIRCYQYEGLEKELENLRCQLREYNSLWNEKEHYKKRSTELDELKEQCLVLSDEASNLETQLNAETEINNIKSKVIEELRNENILLEKKLNDTIIAFEKEKNVLECKLKETECTVMCQEQQIKSLTLQIDRLLEQNQDKAPFSNADSPEIGIIDENEALKEQIRNLKDALFCNEEEKQNLQEEFQEKLKIINELRMEIEDWKSTYDKVMQRNNYLEKYTETFKDEAQRLMEENRNLSQDIEEKDTAIQNLMNVINKKSQEINNLLEDIEHRDTENNILIKQLQDLREKCDYSIDTLVKEKTEAMTSLQLARQESQELLKKIKDYDDVIHKNNDISKTLEAQVEDYNELKSLLLNTIEENKNLQMNLATRDDKNSILLKEIQELREINDSSVRSLNILEEEKNEYKTSFEIKRKESEILAKRITSFESLQYELEKLRNEHEKLLEDKQILQNQLLDKNKQLDNAIYSIEVTKKENGELLENIKSSENIKDELFKSNEAYQNVCKEMQHLQTDLKDKEKNIEMLQFNIIQLREQNQNLLKISENETVLQRQLKELKKTYEDLLNEKELLQNDYDRKTSEFNNLHDALENKIDENRIMYQKIKSFEQQQASTTKNIRTLESEKLAAQSSLDAIRKESSELIDKLGQYELLKKQYGDLKITHEIVVKEKELLQKELIDNTANLKKICQENIELQSQSQTLLLHSESLENALIRARQQNAMKPEVLQKDYTDILAEVENMKKEKNRSVNKIRELLDRLDESENVIANLSEDLLARDDRIAILENHINELEEEVRKLQDCLAKVVNTGEEIKQHSSDKIEQSLKRMEAHHSKATHNMKVELAKLQNKNIKLEEQLSVTKLKTEETLVDQNKYVSQIITLENERELIADDIKQIELNNVGDSLLSPSNCNLGDILTSLDRIRKYIDAKCSKGTTLEQTLLKVQTSSQLLLTKADEAKRIVEKEKQKIIKEKEEAVRDRFIMENQLADLKKTLEEHISRNQAIITDLEAEISNKDLIIEKINKTTQNYVSKLESEMHSLQELYKNSTEKIEELQAKIKNMSKDKLNQLEIMDKCKSDLENKCKEVKDLQNELETWKNQPKTNKEIQTAYNKLQKNEASQTESYQQYMEYERAGIQENMNDIEQSKNSLDRLDKSNPPKQLPPTMKEVQVLTANIEPTLDYVKCSYLNYKMKRLTTRRMEQYSISSITDNTGNDYTAPSDLSTQVFNQSADDVSDNPVNVYRSSSACNKLVDIYNRQSMHTNSSKLMDNETFHDMSQHVKRNFPEQMLNSKSVEVEEKKNKRHKGSEMIVESTSNTTDKGLFVIYRDSESGNTHRISDEKTSLQTKGQSKIFVEAFTVLPNRMEAGEMDRYKYDIQDKTSPKIDSYLHEDIENEDDSVKYKLNISLPRVQNDSPSVVASSEDDKKSLDSYDLGIYPSPKIISSSTTDINSDSANRINNTPSLPAICNNDYTDTKYFETHGIKSKDMSGNTASKQEEQFETYQYKRSENEDISIKNNNKKDAQRQKRSHKKQYQKASDSHHRLSRIGADVLLIKDVKNNKKSVFDTNKMPVGGKFGLNYIINSVEQELNPPNNFSVSDVVIDTRKIRSVDNLNQTQSQRRYARLSDIPVGSKGESSIHLGSDYYQSKSYVNQSVMVNMDINEEYENKIQHLTNALRNAERDFKKKTEAIKIQYDNNIKSIMNEHNEGVRSIQSLHEETLNDIIKVHENEVENLRSMSIEAMRKAEKLEKENRLLKTKIQESSCCLDEEPVKISTAEVKRRRKHRDLKLLARTTVEALNVEPKAKTHGPCTCTIDVNLTDTIRHIFEQVDVEQRKMAEHTYMKYIANKIVNENVEALNSQELSFLHLKVCRIWKMKLTREEGLQKRIDSLEHELLSKRHAQQLSKLDQEVAEERRRLQELREAVCRNTQQRSRTGTPVPEARATSPAPPSTTAEKDLDCNCQSGTGTLTLGERKSAGDLLPPTQSIRFRRTKTESNRAVLAKLDIEENREKKLYSNEPPTRLRKPHDRHALRAPKK